MIDALLHAVRDSIRDGGFGYDYRTCEIRDDGHPPPRCGDIFVAVHQGDATGDMMNALNEYYGWSFTLTMRVANVPLDRLGDQLLAKKVAKKAGFNARSHQLKVFLHMNWGVMQDANNVLVELETQAPVVYGFCEPAAFASQETPQLVGGEWFSAEPEARDVGLKSEVRFERCRRLQAIASYS